MAEIDHLVYAAPDLAAGTAAVEALVGMAAAPGGPHPGMGTRNTLMSLGPLVYLEIIAPDPEQPDPAGGRPFGIDSMMNDSMTGDTMTEGRLITFAIHASQGETIESLAATMTACGEDPGEVTAMSRIKPDGEELHWSLTVSNDLGSSNPRSKGPRLVPFVIDWGATTHPATVTPTGCTLVSLAGTHPDPARIEALYGALGLGIDLHEGPEAALEATIDSPNGRVVLR